MHRLATEPALTCSSFPGRYKIQAALVRRLHAHDVAGMVTVEVIGRKAKLHTSESSHAIFGDTQHANLPSHAGTYIQSTPEFMAQAMKPHQHFRTHPPPSQSRSSETPKTPSEFAVVSQPRPAKGSLSELSRNIAKLPAVSS